MAIKNVERHAAENGVAQSRHLFDLISGRGLTAGAIPRAPFIDHQFYLVFGIMLAHDLPVALYQRFHHIALAEKFVPIDVVKFKRVTFALIPITGAPAAQVPRIIMKRKSVDIAQIFLVLADDFFEETSRPLPTVVVGA